MLTCVLPLMVDARLRQHKPNGLSIKLQEEPNIRIVHIAGDAVAQNVDQAIAHFRNALNGGSQLVVDLSEVRSIDSRMFGLFLMVKKALASRGGRLGFVGASAELRRTFRLNRFEFLLSGERDTDSSIGASSLRPIAFR